jgi:hypothetical protein
LDCPVFGREGLCGLPDVPDTAACRSALEVATEYCSPAGRRRRVVDVIVAHMADSVDPGAEPDGFLLERATAFDLAGWEPEDFPEELRAAVLDHYPRLELAAEFTACFEEQARRKPGSQAAAAVRAGIAGRLAANPLEGR